MPEKSNNLQDIFLNTLRKHKTPVTMFLVKGVKLQGIITWFDNFSVLLRRDGQSQLIYKHAISTVMPAATVDLISVAKAFEQADKKSRQLQDVFLNAVRKTQNPVTMFLVNGVMLQGEIAAYDLFCMLLQREGMVQLVYKHAISTVQPTHPLNLAEEEVVAEEAEAAPD
jgi:host factor-I protein